MDPRGASTPCFQPDLVPGHHGEEASRHRSGNRAFLQGGPECARRRHDEPRPLVQRFRVRTSSMRPNTASIGTRGSRGLGCTIKSPITGSMLRFRSATFGSNGHVSYTHGIILAVAYSCRHVEGRHSIKLVYSRRTIVRYPTPSRHGARLGETDANYSWSARSVASKSRNGVEPPLVSEVRTR